VVEGGGDGGEGQMTGRMQGKGSGGSGGRKGGNGGNWKFVGLGVCMRCLAANAPSIIPVNQIPITKHKSINLSHLQPMFMLPSIPTFTFDSLQVLHIPNTSHLPFYTQINQ